LVVRQCSRRTFARTTASFTRPLGRQFERFLDTACERVGQRQRGCRTRYQHCNRRRSTKGKSLFEERDLLLCIASDQVDPSNGKIRLDPIEGAAGFSRNRLSARSRLRGFIETP
jgi:hypothetical protein